MPTAEGLQKLCNQEGSEELFSYVKWVHHQLRPKLWVCPHFQKHVRQIKLHQPAPLFNALHIASKNSSASAVERNLALTERVKVISLPLLILPWITRSLSPACLMQ